MHTVTSPTTPHHTHNTLGPKVPKNLMSGPIYPNHQTDIDEPVGPPGCVKSKSYIKPNVNVSGLPTNYMALL